MKKFITIALLSVLISAGTVIAQEFETFESLFYVKAKHTLPVGYSKELKTQFMNGKIDNAIVSFLKECHPYEENVEVEVMGFNFTLNLKSDGIINDKCSYNISGRINNISEATRDEYNIYVPNSEIRAVEPRIKCEFTQEQLLLLVDAISSKSADLANEKSIKHAIYKHNTSGLNPADEKLISVFQGAQVCTLTNKDEIIEQLSKMDLSILK